VYPFLPSPLFFPHLLPVTPPLSQPSFSFYRTRTLLILLITPQCQGFLIQTFSPFLICFSFLQPFLLPISFCSFSPPPFFFTKWLSMQFPFSSRPHLSFPFPFHREFSFTPRASLAVFPSKLFPHRPWRPFHVRSVPIGNILCSHPPSPDTLFLGEKGPLLFTALPH